METRIVNRNVQIQRQLRAVSGISSNADRAGSTGLPPPRDGPREREAAGPARWPRPFSFSDVVCSSYPRGVKRTRFSQVDEGTLSW